MTNGERYLIELRAVRDPVQPRERPPAIRLRALLRIALRSFGLKAVSVEVKKETKIASPSPELLELGRET